MKAKHASLFASPNGIINSAPMAEINRIQKNLMISLIKVRAVHKDLESEYASGQVELEVTRKEVMRSLRHGALRLS